jgi:hypothetical protein
MRMASAAARIAGRRPCEARVTPATVISIPTSEAA